MILAIDPGQLCGWALGDGGQVSSPVVSGVWDLDRVTCGRTKWRGLWQEISELAADDEITAIVFEKVEAHPRPKPKVDVGKRWRPGMTNVYAAHAYGGYKALIEFWCDVNGRRAECINVTQIKKHATGKGNANKDMMLNFARLKWDTVHDHNEADALWILDAWRAGVR